MRRAIGATAVILAAGLLIGNGVVGSTFALFNGETKNARSAFAGGYVAQSTGATATPSGYDVALGWTPGTQSVTGQQVLGVDNGQSSNCTGAAYASITTFANNTTATYTDSNRGSAINGNWFCYELINTSATVWTATTALPALQVGLATTAVQVANVLTAGSIAKTDTITLTFNQRTNLTSGTVKVCVFGTAKTILVGDQKNGASCGNTNDGYSIAKLTTAATISADLNFGSATTTVTTTAPYTVTITLAGTNSTAAVGASPTWTATPAAAILSNAITDQATMCTTATSTCQPTTTTNF